MASSAAVPVSRPGAALGRAGGGLARGIAVGYLSLIVLVPLAALVWSSRSQGLDTFWQEVTKPQAASALKLTLGASLLVAAFNAVTGTAVAWVLVRDSFPGKGIVNAVIDLPFALPTVVAGLVLLELYGPSSPFGVDVAFQRAGIVLALLFVTLPFVVRAVQPVLLELDREMEEAAESLGAGRLAVFRRIVFPNLLPAIRRADLGKHPVQDRGFLGLHRGPDRVGQLGRRRGGLRSAASDLARRAACDRRLPALENPA